MRGLLFALVIACWLSGSCTPTHAEVPRPTAQPLSLTVGRIIRLQMANKQIIKTVFIDREGVVKAVPAFNDPRTLLITGFAPGKVRIVVTGEDGQKMALNIGR